MKILEIKQAADLITELSNNIVSLNKVEQTEKFNGILYRGYKIEHSVDVKGKPATTQVSNSFELDDVDSDAAKSFLVTYFSDKIEAICIKLEKLGVDKTSIDLFVETSLKD